LLGEARAGQVRLPNPDMGIEFVTAATLSTQRSLLVTCAAAPFFPTSTFSIFSLGNGLMPKRRVLFTEFNLALRPGALVLFLRAAGQGFNAAPPTGGVPAAAVAALVLVGWYGIGC
jgi:hypothetical protein